MTNQSHEHEHKQKEKQSNVESDMVIMFINKKHYFVLENINSTASLIYEFLPIQIAFLLK